MSANRLPRWWLIVLAVVPVVFITGFYLFPVASLAAKTLSAGAFAELIRDPTLREVLWFTTWQAITSTLVTVVVGLMPAWVLARFEFRGRRWITALITVPFVLPTVVVGAAFLALLPDSLDQGVLAVVLAHVLFNLAVVVRGVGALWEQLPDDLFAAARTLGARPTQVFREVTLPLLSPAITGSATIVFLFTFTSFGVVRLLGGPARPTLEVEIWQRAVRFGQIDIAAMLSLTQLVLLGAVAAWFGYTQSRRRLAFALAPLDMRHKPRRRRDRLAVTATCAAILLVVGAPLVALFERSLRVGDGHSLAAWRTVFGASLPAQSRPVAASPVDPLASLAVSVRFAVVAMIVAVTVGASAAFVIAASRRLGRILDAAMMLPLATSAVTIGFGMIIAFDRPPVDWRAAAFMIPLGHALVAAPFVVRIMLPPLRALDPTLRDAAATLGASPLRTWREVDLRMASRPLAIGMGLALAISLGEFGATSFLTRQGRATLPIAVEQLLNRPGSLLHAQGYVLATILAAATLLIMMAVEWLRSGPARA